VLRGRAPRLPIRGGVTTVGRRVPATTANDATYGIVTTRADGTRVVELSRLRRRIGENLINTGGTPDA
jgi:hypothetical protein